AHGASPCSSPAPAASISSGGSTPTAAPSPRAKGTASSNWRRTAVRSTDISRSLQVSNGCVSKILSRYYRTGSVGPKRLGGWKRRAVPPHVEERIAQLKRERPSVFAWEIRRQLHVEGGGGKRGTPSLPFTPPPPSQPPSQLQNPGPPQGPPRGPPQGPPPRRSRQRSRTVLSQQQCKALEEEFQRGQYPDSSTRRRLAATTQLPDTTIQVWFSNRRAKWRREAMQRMEANGAGSWCEWLLSPPSTTAPISAQNLPAAPPPSLLEPLGAPPGLPAPLHLCTPRPCSWDDGCCGSSPLPPPWQPLEGPPLTLLPSCPPLHPTAHLHAPPCPWL
uniref:Paired box protein Pax-6 n=1 Tax=Gallus gallus TaxID=9031 RepID=A0A8V0XXN4_CHICK